MKKKLMIFTMLVCALAASYSGMAQGFIGTGTTGGNQIVGVTSTGSNVVQVGIGTATPSVTFDVYAPTVGTLGVKLEHLPRVGDSTILYYEPSTGTVTYGPFPTATVSAFDFDCGIGTLTIDGTPSAHRAWLLSGSTTIDTNDYLGTYNADDLRIATNNGSCQRNWLKEKMVVGTDANHGNVEIGWDGITSFLPSSTNYSKLTVQNGAVSETPLNALTSGLGIPSADIGIAAYANTSDPYNIGVISIADNPGVTPSQNSVGYMTLISGSTVSNNGMYGIITGSGTSNTGFLFRVDDGNNGTNNGGNISVGPTPTTAINTGLSLGVNGSSMNNSGVVGNVIQNNSANNTGYQFSVDGANAANTGGNINVGSTYTTTATNTGISIGVAGSSHFNVGINTIVTQNNTAGNQGVSATVSGTSVTGPMVGFIANVSGSSTGSCTGMIFDVTGSSIDNSGTNGTAHGDNVTNTGLYGAAYGNSASLTPLILQNYGVYGRITPNPSSNNDKKICVGVLGSIDGNADGYENFGVSGDLHALTPSVGNTKPYYAIYGIAPGYSYLGTSSTLVPGFNTNNVYAGYFEGDVFCGQTYYYSDPKLKENIQEYAGALDQLKKLPVKSYTFRNGEYPKMNLPLGDQVGVLSTDLKAVFPNLVKGGMHPGSGKDDPRVTFEAVNYNALIPVLIEAVQELDVKTNAKPADDDLAKTVTAQQTQIAAQTQQLAEQSKQIAELRTMIEDLCSNGCAGFKPNSGPAGISPAISTSAVSGSAVLYQSSPNPTSGLAVIAYAINMPFTTATIQVSDKGGKSIRQYSVQQQGAGSVTFDSGSIAAGTYNYSLIIDGRVHDTKTMVIVKD